MDIDRVTTLPDHAAIKKITLPELPQKNPLVYVPVEIHSEKIGGVMLGIGIFLMLSACTVVNVALLFVHQIIIVK